MVNPAVVKAHLLATGLHCY